MILGDVVMTKQAIENIIDKAIKEIWMNEIAIDYKSGWLLKEDTLKNSLYFHLRNKLGGLFEENNIRIFTEFTDDKFRGKHKRPDMVIAKVPPEQVSEYWGNDVVECLAVIEIKFKTGYKSSEDIFNDYEKLKYYKTELGIDCKLYMATIWEYEDGETNWERKNSAWAKNVLTELNASYDIDETDEYEMRFYVWEH